MFKVVTLMKRNPELQVSEFQSLWKTDHALLAAQLPGLRRYVQSHALLKGYTKGELLYDGISEMWFDSAQDYYRAMASAQAVNVLADQTRLLDMSKKVVMVIDLHVIKDGSIPANAVKNIEFVNKRPGMGLIDFRRHWKEIHGPIASRIESVRRYEQNHLALAEYDMHNPPVFDGLAITWFDSTQAMKEGAKTDAYQITRADEPHFLPDAHLPIIITTEHTVVG